MEDDELTVETTGEQTRPDTGAEFRPDDAADPLHLRGMYRNWFLDYASYVILERAVPRIDDGLKPVQRRILHSMKILDDGRYNKVANIVGHTMQFHPHGDASIYEALVQLGQKELLVDTQGNWGNTLTGASAAAGRYIEARLSQFALDVVFNAKITQWTPSYDGRKDEPVAFPVKFPLLLAQGVEGIAVGLSSKILPHNFNELIDACVACLRGQPFQLFPDFPTGGSLDISRYNDGERGGVVKIRAKIEKVDNKTLAVTEIPYGKTTATVIDSILKAFESGKIKIRRVDDNTAQTARILVHLQPGTSSDRTIDALYAFTDCEVSVSPNCCVIDGDRPAFLTVTDVLRRNVATALDAMRRELQLQLDEVTEQLHYASLEKIFIEERIYKDKEYETAPDRDAAVRHIALRLEKIDDRRRRQQAKAAGTKVAQQPSIFVRPVTDDDITRLFEIKMGRILKFNGDRQDELMAQYRDRMARLAHDLAHLTDYAVDWYLKLKEKYGHDRPRRTTLRNFDSIQATTVAEANEKLYYNREEGFIGTGLKKDECLGPCSSIDDVIIFYRDGRYKVSKVQEKLFIGKGVLTLDKGRDGEPARPAIFIYRRGDSRTIYNTVYQNGRGGAFYIKRFAVTGVTRDKEYNLTQGQPGSRVAWFTANPNGEAETIKVILKAKPKLKKLQIDADFASVAVKGRGTRGNLLTKNDVYRISLKERGASTLGGIKVWFDPDVLRLNNNGQGRLLGEFHADDKILVVTSAGEYYTTTYETSNHYPEGMMRIEKFDPRKVWTSVVRDADQQGRVYLKRFRFEDTARPRRWMGDNPGNELLFLTDDQGARFEITFGGKWQKRTPEQVVARNSPVKKSSPATGALINNKYDVASVAMLEPLEPEPMPEPEVEDVEAKEAEPSPAPEPSHRQTAHDQTNQPPIPGLETE